MNPIVIFSALVLMSACALLPRATLAPDGKPVIFIDGMSAAVIYDKATKACHNGYSIVQEPVEKAFIDYEMTVECK